MSFFNSDIVRAEMSEIAMLQEDIYCNVFTFPTMNTEEKKFHIALLEKLLNKQKVLYTRLSLSDDKEAIEMNEKIVELNGNVLKEDYLQKNFDFFYVGHLIDEPSD